MYRSPRKNRKPKQYTYNNNLVQLVHSIQLYTPRQNQYTSGPINIQSK